MLTRQIMGIQVSQRSAPGYYTDHSATFLFSEKCVNLTFDEQGCLMPFEAGRVI